MRAMEPQNARGITPARAGKSKAYRQHPTGRGDHPRACGEELDVPRGKRKSKGSPPRVRGRVRNRLFCGFLDGITPARAGKSLSRLPLLAPPRDHPRACGEEYLGFPPTPKPRGSPPRVRGRVGLRRRSVCARRITPARAGKSRNRLSRLRGGEDHPRACGEEAKIFRAECGPTGSPPRVRGRAVAGVARAAGAGITPARAGKSLLSCFLAFFIWDHPRACGEEVAIQSAEMVGQGSPPRVRGRAHKGLRPAWVGGITPARAGKRL